MDHFSHDPLDGPTAEEPARSRDSLLLTAQLCLAGSAGGQQVRVRNLSPGGLMAEYQGGLTPGIEVECEVRGIGRVSGTVAWVADGRIGVTFDRQIDPLLARKRVGAAPKAAAKTAVYVKSTPRR